MSGNLKPVNFVKMYYKYFEFCNTTNFSFPAIKRDLFDFYKEIDCDVIEDIEDYFKPYCDSNSRIDDNCVVCDLKILIKNYIITYIDIIKNYKELKEMNVKI